MTKRRYALVVPLAISAMVVAACGSSGGSGSSSSNKKTLTIGFQGPLSGGNAALGINEKFGVQLAVKQANDKGDLPFKLEVATADDLGSGDGGPPAAQKLIGNSNVVAVVGPSFSGASNSTGKLYKAANMLVVTPSATLPDITSHGFTTYYRAVADDNAQGPPDAKYLVNKVGAKKIYVVDDTTDYGKGLARAFTGTLSSLSGATKVGSDSAPQTSGCIAGATGSTSQYPSLASKVKNTNPDAVFYAGYYCDLGLFAKALRDKGFTGQIMSGDGSKDNRYISGAGATVANGSLISCQCSDIASNPNGASFISAYKTLSGQEPGAYSAEAFDVTNAIIGVMKGLGSNINRASLVGAFGTVDYQGLTKTIQFASAENHNLKVQAAFLYKVENGKFTYLGDLTKLTS
ncbi:MAG: branched-chain amino acid ABC transporter substrate-binding protein [Actinomycetes bacterium]